MRNGAGGTRSLAAVLLAFGIFTTGLCSAQEPAAVSFLQPSSDRQCDEFNRSWVVRSQHTFLSIKVVVRWAVVGAKDMQEEFILAPGASRAIGCASKLEIVSAEIMQF